MCVLSHVCTRVPTGEEFDLNGDWEACDWDGNVIEKPEGWVSVSYHVVYVDKTLGFTMYEVCGYALDEDCKTELEDGTIQPMMLDIDPLPTLEEFQKYLDNAAEYMGIEVEDGEESKN